MVESNKKVVTEIESTLKFLGENSIPYQTFMHAPAFTVEEYIQNCKFDEKYA